MTTPEIEYLSTEWAKFLDLFPAPVFQRVQALAQAHQDTLASHFYEQMLQDPVASKLLSHEQVKSRLSLSLKRWIIGLFDARVEDLDAVIALQEHIGQVHARIEVPVYLVLRGARNLKEGFLALLRAERGLDADERVDAIRLTSVLIDLAMESMSRAYSHSHDRNSRAEESYRLFSVAQNIATERQRQRAALLDWENQMMFDHAVGVTDAQLGRIRASEFGLWFRHKGAHAFQGTTEAELILQAMQDIDEVLLPALDSGGSATQEEKLGRLRSLREETKSIGFHMERLFEQNNELEAGRDPLTRLLSRKFLAVVMAKEVNYARNSGTQFAVLAIDIDHFKRINDSYGHEAGDMVLQQFSSLLSDIGRGGDYVFRLGGEEFLMLLVDTTIEGATRVAEKLRRAVFDEVFQLPQERSLRSEVTISIGVALHHGHPDYQHIMRRADEALYQAKNRGRNCVVVADQQINKSQFSRADAAVS